MAKTPGPPRNLYSLDALRGVASLAVVFWHWQHFFYAGHELTSNFTRETQPLFSFFFLFYRSGWLASDLFFSLSGFIFFWLYSQAITNHTMTPRTFFILRFSRLYPLHMVTLMSVIVGQAIYTSIHGDTFIYANHDARHFILNILMIPSIGLEHGYSFNGPIWSVSVEVVLYAVFFVVCWHTKPRLLYLIALSATGFLAVSNLYEPVGRGLGSFFLGGCVHQFFLCVLRSRHLTPISVMAVIATIAMWCGTIYWSYSEAFHGASGWLGRLSSIFPMTILFPSTILSLALVESRRGTLGKRISFLGDISYSSYLWHFPLQLVFVLVAPLVGATTLSFQSAASLILYFVTLVAISLASYKFIERPAQRRIRQAWLVARTNGRPEAES